MSVFPEYKGQSASQLISMDIEYGEEIVLTLFRDAIELKVEKTGINSLTHSEKLVLSILIAESEIYLGGFSSFLHGQYSESAILLPRFFSEAGLEKCSEMMQAAIKISSSPGDDQKYIKLDTDFLDLSEQIASKLIKFIINNIDDFPLSN